MGLLVRLICGIWEKSAAGLWSFNPDRNEPSYDVMMDENQTYSSAVEIVRSRYGVSPDISLALTYAFPEWMNIPNDPTTPPVDIRDTEDMRLFMAVRVACPEMSIFVTIGAYAVDRYRYQKSSCYSIGEPSSRVVTLRTRMGDHLNNYPTNPPANNANEVTYNPHSDVPDSATGFWNGLLEAGWVPPSEQYMGELINSTGLPLFNITGNSSAPNMDENGVPPPPNETFNFSNTVSLTMDPDVNMDGNDEANHLVSPITPVLNTAPPQPGGEENSIIDGVTSGDHRRWFAATDQRRLAMWTENQLQLGGEIGQPPSLDLTVSRNLTRSFEMETTGSSSNPSSGYTDRLPRGWIECSERVLNEICTEEEMAKIKKEAFSPDRCLVSSSNANQVEQPPRQNEESTINTMATNLRGAHIHDDVHNIPYPEKLPPGWIHCSEAVLLELCQGDEMVKLRHAAREFSRAFTSGSLGTGPGDFNVRVTNVNEQTNVCPIHGAQNLELSIAETRGRGCTNGTKDVVLQISNNDQMDRKVESSRSSEPLTQNQPEHFIDLDEDITAAGSNQTNVAISSPSGNTTVTGPPSVDLTFPRLSYPDGRRLGFYPASEQVLLEICTDSEMEQLRQVSMLMNAEMAHQYVMVSDDDRSSTDSSGQPSGENPHNMEEDGIIQLGEEKIDQIQSTDLPQSAAEGVNPPQSTPLAQTEKEKGKVIEGCSNVEPTGSEQETSLHTPMETESPPNTELSSDAEAETDPSNARGLVGKGKRPSNDIFVGQMFLDQSTFKQHMSMYALANKFRFKMKRSEPGKMVLECSGTNCPWRVYAARVKNCDWYELRRATLSHLCTATEREDFQKHASSSVIGKMIKSKFSGHGAAPTPATVKDIMRDDHEVPISYWKAWRSRESALNFSKGTTGESYQMLPDYLQQLVVANPGTVVYLETDFEVGLGQRFKYLFFSLGASIAGLSNMRKVIILDGTHLKGKYGGCLLTASAQDGNYQIFPIGFGVVDGETESAWGWFLGKLAEIVPDAEELVFVTDRHRSIYAGIQKIYPRAQHCACIVHLQRNIQTYFKKPYIGYLVSQAARAYRISDFHEIFNEITAMDPACAEYLKEIGFIHWTRSYFCGDRFDVMSSNTAESFNSAMVKARDFPIIPLVEYIRALLMTWFSIRRQIAAKSTSSVTRRVQRIINQNFVKSTGYVVKNIDKAEFEVREKEGTAFVVDLEGKLCSCRQFQMLGIPCTHAVAAAVNAKFNVESLAAPVYSSATWVSAYGGAIYPVQGSATSVQPSESLADINLFPPSTRRPPGRPRKKRLLSQGEFKGGLAKRPRKCSRCGGGNHNRASCKRPI